MIFRETALEGVFIVDIERKCDDRGFFARIYCADEFAAVGLDRPMLQDSISYNRAASTLRGMHYHAAPYPQTRLVRCIAGSAFFVVLDLRPQSATSLGHRAFVLGADSYRALYVPTGCALGYVTLEADTTLLYQMPELYDPRYERGLRWNDPTFAIDWPVADPIMNERDATYDDFDPEMVHELV